jgi:hypothetical protein
MHENDSLVLGEDKIWFAGQLCSMQPVAEALGMQRAPQEQFRLGILASNARHQPRTGFGIDYVSQSDQPLWRPAGSLVIGS